LGNRRVTVIDDGRLPAGVMQAPVDGEGMPTGPVVLIEEGTFRQSLVDWRAEASGSPPVHGWARRESWRDLPATAPSHLYLQSHDEVAVADLVDAVSRGFYLLEPLGPGQFDFADDRFRIPVCGFVLRQGKATAPVSRVWLEGSIGALLRNVRAVARDLEFYPLTGMIGAPTMLVTGLGLRGID
jgi:predicted Zn-dependent protease